MGSYKSGKKEKGTPREWLDYDSRDGNRGGRAQFSWDALRDDKTRSFYMGNSLKVDGARANMGKDMHWWTKGGAAPSSSSLSTASARSGSSSTKSSSISAEKALMKQREKELMEKALRPTAPAVGSGSGGGIFDRSRSKRQAPDDAAPPAKRPRS